MNEFTLAHTTIYCENLSDPEMGRGMNKSASQIKQCRWFHGDFKWKSVLLQMKIELGLLCDLIASKIEVILKRKGFMGPYETTVETIIIFYLTRPYKT